MSERSRWVNSLMLGILLTIVNLSCGGDGGGSGPTVTPEIAVLTASIDGSPFNAASPDFCLYPGGGFSTYGQSGGNILRMWFAEPHSVPATFGSFAVQLMMFNASTGYTDTLGRCGGSGSMTISEMTADRLKGEFQFSLQKSCGTTPLVHVSNGKFDLPLAEYVTCH